MPASRLARWTSTALVALLMAGCGGGSTVNPNPPPPPPAPPPPPPPPPAPPGTRVVLDGATLGQNGGDLRVTQADAALRGLSISVPSGAYPTTTSWTVTEISTLRPTLPEGVRQVGPAIQIQNGQGYSDAPFTISVPARVSTDSGIALFYHDASTGVFEMVPVLQRTDTSLVVLTRHVSGDEVLVPSGAALRTASARTATPGLATFILLAAAATNLRGIFQSGFRPGVDDWEFSNLGDFLNPNGYCGGASLTAIYHYYTRKASRGALFGLYDKLNTLEADNPLGVRIASVVQKTNGSATFDAELQQILAALTKVGVSAGGPAWVRIQTDAMALAIRMTESPQFLAIFQQSMTNGHAIIAHGIETEGNLGRVLVSDPNHPGVERAILFSNEKFFEYVGSTYNGGPQAEYPHIFVAGVTALMSIRGMAANWSAVEAKTIGQGQYPAMTIEYRDPVDTLWRAAGEKVRTASSSVTFRTRCSGCPVPRSEASQEAQRMLSVVYDNAGTLIGHDNPDAADGVDVPVEMGNNDFGLEEQATPTGTTDWRYVNFTWLAVERVPFELSMEPQFPAPGQETTFKVENGGMGNSTSRYRWTVGDDPPVITDFGTRTLTPPPPTAASYAVTVELIDPDDNKLAKAELRVGAQPFWRITSFFDQDDLLDMNQSSPLGTLLGRILAAPQSGLIAIDEDAGGRTVLRLRVLQGGLWGTGNCCPPSQAVLPGEIQQTLGTMPEETHAVGPAFTGWNVNRWSQTTEELGEGVLTGQYVDGLTVYEIKDVGSQTGPRGVLRITGNRSGTTMTGEITITGWFSDEDDYVDTTPATFRFPFTAVRIR